MDGRNEQRVAIKCCFKADLFATETLVLVQKAYGSEAVNRSNVFRWYSRFRDGRELVEDDKRGGHPKSTRTEVHCCCCLFCQKWPSNRIKNDSRIFEYPQDCSSSDYERGFWKEKVACTFCSTLLDNLAKGRSSHILPSSRILDSWWWDRLVVPKRRQEITSTRCLITQDSADLIHFLAEAWNHTYQGFYLW